MQTVYPITPSKRKNGNKYFDVELKKSRTESIKLRVMDDSLKNQFEEFQENKSPVKCTMVSPTKSVVFFNNKSEVCVSKELSFTADDIEPMTVEEIKTNQPLGTFNAIGEVLWLEAAHEVNTRNGQRMVRDAMFCNANGENLPMAVWGRDLIDEIKHGSTYLLSKLTSTFYKDQLKLQTTHSTVAKLSETQIDVAWDSMHNTDISKLCCPDVLFVNITKYLQCRNVFCNRKIGNVDEFESETTLKCPHCDCLLKKSKLKGVFSIEATLEVKENKELKLTFFPNVLEQFFSGNDDADSMGN